MIKQYMQTIIFESFETALIDFTKFLLSFILRERDVKNSKVIDEVKYNPWMQL